MQRVATSDDTQWRIHTRYDFSGEIGPSRRIYLTTDMHKKQTSMPPPGFKHEIAANELPTPTPILRANNHHTNFPGIKPGLPQWDALCTQRPCGKTLTADFSVGFNSGRLLGIFVMNKV
jgi:hypothetical protein